MTSKPPAFGFGPGDIDCGDVLDELTVFLDDETDARTKERIAAHLDACSPCLKQLGIEREVRALIGRCCGSDRAPESLHASIRVRITELTVQTPQTLETTRTVEVRNSLGDQQA